MNTHAWFISTIKSLQVDSFLTQEKFDAVSQSDEKYRCGETGYRIRLKCVPSGSGSKDTKSLNAQKTRSTLEIMDFAVNQRDTDLTISSTRQRRLLGDSSKSEGVSRGYVTYRSCIPAVNEEKMSVLGFEVSSFHFYAFHTSVLCPTSRNFTYLLG